MHFIGVEKQLYFSQRKEAKKGVTVQNFARRIPAESLFFAPWSGVSRSKERGRTESEKIGREAC